MSTTVGKVQYQWVKYQRTLGNAAAVTAAASEETKIQTKPVRRGRYKGRVSLAKEKARPLKTEMTVMFSHPTRIFCCWDIPHSIIRQVREFHGLREDQFHYCLRVFDVTSISFDGHNHHGQTDIIIPPQAAHWFINSLKPNRAYCIEYGVVDESGRFTGITRSNVIHTPRTGHDQEYHHLNELQAYESGKSKKPQWVEHVSTYSYYLKN
ncbi:DUF4912 domain-containing protein [Bacillus salacetis]|nr:DUF4912 domain-containing protein [Bacillus salacetis]